MNMKTIFDVVVSLLGLAGGALGSLGLGGDKGRIVGKSIELVTEAVRRAGFLVENAKDMSDEDMAKIDATLDADFNVLKEAIAQLAAATEADPSEI